MTKSGKKLIVLAVAWILWEHVVAQNGPERWRSYGTTPSETVCMSNGQTLADQGKAYYFNTPNVSFTERIGVNPPGFRVVGNDRTYRIHTFECYPSDFDPRPRG